MSSESVAAYSAAREASEETHETWFLKQAHGKSLRRTTDDAAVPVLLKLAINERVTWDVLGQVRTADELDRSGIMPPKRMRRLLYALTTSKHLEFTRDPHVVLLQDEIDDVMAVAYGKPKVKHASTNEARESVAAKVNDKVATIDPTSTMTAEEIAAIEKIQSSALSEQQRQLIKSVEVAFKLMKSQDHYEFLGLTRTAEQKDVIERVRTLMRQWHPDVIGSGALSGNDTFKTKVDTLALKLNEIRDTLGALESRREYNRGLEKIKPSALQKMERAKDPAQALEAFERGETALKKREWKEAEIQLKTAVEYDHTNPVYHVAHARSVLMNELREKQVRQRQALSLLNETWKTFKYPDAGVLLATIRADLGRDKEAVELIDAVLEIDGQHADALREKRILEGKQEKKREERIAAKAEKAEKDGEGKSFLSKLFKK